MPPSDREYELLRLLNLYRSHLEPQLTVDPDTVEPFGPLDAVVQPG